MKALRLALSAVLATATLLSLNAAGENTVKVQGSRALSLAIVDLDRNNAASEELSEAFREALSFEMSQRCKMPTPIKPARVDAPRAGWGLATGMYDVAIVIGGAVPRTMVSSENTMIRATPQSGQAKRMLTLVTRKEDPNLAKLLGDSFPEALKGPFFQKALFRYSGTPEASGDTEWKIAGLGN